MLWQWSYTTTAVLAACQALTRGAPYSKRGWSHWSCIQALASRQHSLTCESVVDGHAALPPGGLVCCSFSARSPYRKITVFDSVTLASVGFFTGSLHIIVRSEADQRSSVTYVYSWPTPEFAKQFRDCHQIFHGWDPPRPRSQRWS